MSQDIAAVLKAAGHPEASAIVAALADAQAKPEQPEQEQQQQPPADAREAEARVLLEALRRDIGRGATGDVPLFDRPPS